MAESNGSKYRGKTSTLFVVACNTELPSLEAIPGCVQGRACVGGRKLHENGRKSREGLYGPVNV